MDIWEADTTFSTSMPETPDVVSPSTNIYGMFHLDAGGGIKPYREYLISRLSAMGDAGQSIWQQIIQHTEMMEQDLATNTNKDYPRTLEAAVQTYT